MIFVTVGTHEQPFDRLLRAVDAYAAQTNEQIIVQSGYTDYEMKNCQFSKLLPYEDMVRNVADARIVITHGGPSSFIMPLQVGKTPIVVPRQARYGEHVNDHQLEFALEVEKRQGNILVLKDVEKLAETIRDYDTLVGKMQAGLSSNNAVFMEKFNTMVEQLFQRK